MYESICAYIHMVWKHFIVKWPELCQALGICLKMFVPPPPPPGELYS